MQPVNIGIIGLGNVGEGTLTILTENAAHIESKLGFPLRVAAVCSRGIATKQLPAALGQINQAIVRMPKPTSGLLAQDTFVRWRRALSAPVVMTVSVTTMLARSKFGVCVTQRRRHAQRAG